MNLSLFDQNRKNENTTYGEAVRLSNELRSKPAHTYINADGIRIDVPAQQGFDIETCDIRQIKDWLNDSTKPKSQSLLMFVYRVIYIRFPSEFTTQKQQIDAKFQKELDMIESEAKNEIEWFGLTGFQNCVRLDGSLIDKRRTVIIKDDRVIVT